MAASIAGGLVLYLSRHRKENARTATGPGVFTAVLPAGITQKGSTIEAARDNNQPYYLSGV
jgi:hypothetical protein